MSRRDPRFAALYRSAFSVTLFVVLGCGGAVASTPEAEEADGTHEKDAPAPAAPLPSEPGAEADAGLRADCSAVLGEGIPTPGGFQTEPVARSADVLACCATVLSQTDAATSPRRWDCCVSYDPTASGSQAFGLSPHDLRLSNTYAEACTP